jgi:hypothetical protein
VYITAQMYCYRETNLKCRQCLLETAAMGQDDAQLGAFDGEIVCETPNNLLNKFDGMCPRALFILSLSNTMFNSICFLLSISTLRLYKTQITQVDFQP